MKVAFGGVIWDSAQRDGALAVAGCQRELQFTGRDNRVVVEKLVEIAHPEEKQGIRVRGFGCGKLPHGWSCRRERRFSAGDFCSHT